MDTGSEGSLRHSITQSLLMEEKLENLGAFSLLLDHLRDGPAGPLTRQVALHLEVEVDECVNLIVHHGVDYWRESV